MPVEMGHRPYLSARSIINPRSNIMATYIVFTKESTQDQSELNIYQSKVRKTFEGHPIKLLAAYGPQQALEGPAPGCRNRGVSNHDGRTRMV
jgi:hypothetical protein